MNTERVEAAAKALWNATLPGIAWDELREASREPVRVQARAALAAADAASGEKVAFVNTTTNPHTVPPFRVNPGHEVVVRKVRGR